MAGQPSSAATAPDPHSDFIPGLAGRFETADFDAFATSAAPGWRQRYRKVGTVPFRARIELAHTTSMQLGAASWSTTVAIEGVCPGDSVAFVLATSNGGAVLSKAVLELQSFGGICGNSEFQACSGSLGEIFVLCMRQSRWAELIGRLTGADAGSLRLDGRHGAIRLADAAATGTKLRALLARAMAEPGMLTAPAEAPKLEWAAAAALAAGLAASPRLREPHRGRRLAVEAESWLRAHLHLPVHMAELCTALETNARTLHRVFRETYATTPMAYLRALRLDEARRDLRRGDCRTVTEVATRWGFFHFGAFAAQYKRHFGELPSRTVARTL